MSKKGFTKVTITSEVFEHVQTLIGAKLTNKQITDITKVSNQTICRIKAADNFADYKAQRQAYLRDYKARKAAGQVRPLRTKAAAADEVQPNPVQHSPQIAAVEAGQFYANINRIANALERLAEAWENTPNKKGLFK